MSELLDNITLGDLISKCLFGKNWEKYKGFVIPRKGNFLNPQYDTDTDTYAIYHIERREKKITNFTETDYDSENPSVMHYASLKTSVKIQFIGRKAEQWADSVMFWDERMDVVENFSFYHSQLLLGDRIIETIPFQQDGYNGEMSYLASLELITNITKEEIVEYLTDLIWLKGSLKVEE